MREDRLRWYYLVDIIDGYSRFMVNWSLNLTMESETVTMTVQKALEKLENRKKGEPRIVHDNGSQFTSHEWRNFVKGAGMTDIKTRIAHPESNGRVERLHRTHRHVLADAGRRGLDRRSADRLLCNVGCHGALG